MQFKNTNFKNYIIKQLSTIIPKEPNFVNNTKEEYKKSLIEGIVYVSVNMFFGHLNPLGSHRDKKKWVGEQ